MVLHADGASFDCTAWFLACCGPVLIHGPGFGDPWSRSPSLFYRKIEKVEVSPQLVAVIESTVSFVNHKVSHQVITPNSPPFL